VLRRLIKSRPTSAGRTAYTALAAALLQAYPSQSPELLFNGERDSAASDKPFAYLFVNLLLIDIRSSFPSLLSKLNSAEYSSISQRLANALDIISGFVGYLVKTLDDDVDGKDSVSFNMPPDLLLKLRKDIAETMSLAIEYLRDRYDASIAGTAGLHPSARTGTAATSEGTRLTLTWDSMKDNITKDPLILAAIRTLAIWLREDENENLRKESAALMDLFMDLYSNPESSVDYRFPMLTALEGILTTDEGVDGFLGQNGWSIVAQDLSLIVQGMDNKAAGDPTPLAARGIEIVRILLAVVDHPSTIQPREDWMQVVKRSASMKRSVSLQSPLVFELQIAVLQLAAALLIKGPVGMQRRYVQETTAILGLAKGLLQDVNRALHGVAKEELGGSLDDVILSLENIR
jgi:hypothetical protein